MVTLTKNWQYLGQAYLGKSGGSLYVRVYARYTEQDIANNRTYVQYQGRAYYENGTYILDEQGTIGVSGTGANYQSQACTKPTTGETNAVTTGGWVSHNNEGTKNISCSASIKFPNWGWSGTANGAASLPTIPRASGVACSSPNIGETAIITIDRKSTAFTNTITYNIGGITGTVAEKTTKETISLDTNSLKEKIYALIPNDKRIGGTIYCTTYNGNTKIGDTKSTGFYLYTIEEDCKADITAEIIDTNEKVTVLTNKFIKYISKPKVTISAIPKLSSTIAGYSINLNDGQTSDLQENTFENIGSNKVTVSTVDSRGYQNSMTYELDMIDYIKLHINTISLIRPEGTSNEVLLNVDGVWYNGKFNEEKINTLTCKFQYRLSDEIDWTDGDKIALNITDNTFKVENYSLGNIFDYDNEYQFKIIFQDEFMIVGNLSPDIITVPKGQEIVALGENGGWIYGNWQLNDNPLADYQIGDLFLTTRSENPSERFGGTWELYGKGKTLVCVDDEDNDFNTVRKTGGSKYLQKHSHGINTWSGSEQWSLGYIWSRAAGNGSNNTQSSQSPNTYDAGSGDSGNLQPYITCFIWIRTE